MLIYLWSRLRCCYFLNILGFDKLIFIFIFNDLFFISNSFLIVGLSVLFIFFMIFLSRLIVWLLILYFLFVKSNICLLVVLFLLKKIFLFKLHSSLNHCNYSIFTFCVFQKVVSCFYRLINWLIFLFGLCFFPFF